jgi:hypothetical protein
MSRGRGRGRGGGGGNATRDAFNAAFAGMSKEDSRALFESFSRPTKGSGMMYPVSNIDRRASWSDLDPAGRSCGGFMS